MSKGSSQIIVPDLRGLGLSEATVQISELGLKIGNVKSEENAQVDKDKIISTMPEANRICVGKGNGSSPEVSQRSWKRL